jgi:hypothetical protein
MMILLLLSSYHSWHVFDPAFQSSSPLLLWKGVVIICTCPSLDRLIPAIVSSRQHRRPALPCGKPSCHQQQQLETIAGISSSPTPDFIKMLSTLIVVDVTVVSPIQELYLNASTLNDVNLPMSDASKHKVAKYLPASPFKHPDPFSSLLFSTRLAESTTDFSSSCSTQVRMLYNNHLPAPRTTHAGATLTTGSKLFQSPTSQALPAIKSLNIACLS